MRILLVEDDHATAQSIELMMKSEGFNVYTTDLGEEAVDLGKIYDYDLILLDLNLPDINGLEVLRRLRVGKVNTPIMILTGCSEIETKVKCFGGGADDFMTKPFHKDELIARSHAVVRRSKGHAHAIVTVGNISLNLDAKIVEVKGRRVHLTGKEYQSMELLFLRKGTTITKEMLLNHLYGGMDEPELKIVDVFICKLRKKLATANGGQHHIETVWGRGYVARSPNEPTLLSIAPVTLDEEAPVETPAEVVHEEVMAEVVPISGPVLVPDAEPPPVKARSRSPLKGLVFNAICSGKSKFKDILVEVCKHLAEAKEVQVRNAITRLIQEKTVISTRGDGTGIQYTAIVREEAAA